MDQLRQKTPRCKLKHQISAVRVFAAKIFIVDLDQDQPRGVPVLGDELEGDRKSVV